MDYNTARFNNYWWIDTRQDWLKIPCIAATLMIVVGLMIITYRICSQRFSHIYKPSSTAQRSLSYNSVCELPASAFDDVNFDVPVNNQLDVRVIYATDSSVI